MYETRQPTTLVNHAFLTYLLTGTIHFHEPIYATELMLSSSNVTNFAAVPRSCSGHVTVFVFIYGTLFNCFRSDLSLTVQML